MSRTIRRKGKVPEWVKEDSYWDNKLRRCVSVPLKGLELKRSIAKYHRDTKEGYGWNGNAPKNWRKMIDRSKKSKEKAETSRILKQWDFEDYGFNPRKRDAGWYYWMLAFVSCVVLEGCVILCTNGSLI